METSGWGSFFLCRKNVLNLVAHFTGIVLPGGFGLDYGSALNILRPGQRWALGCGMVNGSTRRPIHNTGVGSWGWIAG